VKDFNVSLRGQKTVTSWDSQATPRVSFGGPIGDGSRWSFSEVYEYDVRRDPVRGLAWPRNEIKSKVSIRLLAFKAILSSQHVFNADVNVFPMRTQFANITGARAADGVLDYDKKAFRQEFRTFTAFAQGPC